MQILFKNESHLVCSFSDLSFCSKPINCEENLFYENCGQVENARYLNHGCKVIDAYTYEFFDCANRNDKRQIMFENPPFPTKAAYYYYKGILFNKVLSFDENHIYCGK